MSLQQYLQALFAVVMDEASRNPEFASRLEKALNLGADAEKKPLRADDYRANALRRANKRAPAVLDPVAVYREASESLKPRLALLDIEQIHDIVSQYRMDPGGLARKWKTKERLIDLVT